MKIHSPMRRSPCNFLSPSLFGSESAVEIPHNICSDHVAGYRKTLYLKYNEVFFGDSIILVVRYRSHTSAAIGNIVGGYYSEFYSTYIDRSLLVSGILYKHTASIGGEKQHQKYVMSGVWGVGTM